MNAVPETLPQTSLESEWARIELLAYSLGQERLGKQVPKDLLDKLQGLQSEVERLRGQLPHGPWSRLASCDWTTLMFDVIALVVAPVAEPRLGWMYQQLQTGQAQPYPSTALIRELLALDESESRELYRLLDEPSPLRREGLIRIEGNDPYQPILPGTDVVARLLGWPQSRSAPAGSIPVRLRADWDELILPDNQLQHLREFLYWIQQRETVTETWGGGPTGGPIALFAGPSGTGKTFAAAVLATELGWPLYRVDLGALVSKYIGETEKNLNCLFDAAHGQEMILQFDEADSLFAKRGEIKEARDRYANMEVSHLLARIEYHQGPVILTTNLRHQIDPAFARRFQVVVDFPRPDAKARGELWRRLLPPRAPRSAELDETFLGRTVNLTGGAIRNAAMYAAYVAAGTGTELGHTQIALAAWRELAKDGREVTNADLGPLAEWLSAELTAR